MLLFFVNFIRDRVYNFFVEKIYFWKDVVGCVLLGMVIIENIVIVLEYNYWSYGFNLVYFGELNCYYIDFGGVYYEEYIVMKFIMIGLLE